MTEKSIELKIRADSANATQNIGQVADALDTLAGKLGGEVGEQAAKAARSLRALGEQKQSIEVFQALQRQAGQAETTLAQLTREAEQYGRQIGQAGPPTANEAAQLERLRAAAAGADAELARQKEALAGAAAAMQGHGVSTAGASGALARIDAEIRRTTADMAALDERTARAVAPLAGVSAGAARAGASVSALGDAAHRMAAQMAAAFTFRELVQSAAQMEQLRAGLTAVLGSAEQAGQGMEFVRGVANRVGADVTQVGQAFLGLAAATKGTAVEGEPTRAVFEAVATAMGRAGKSSAETQNALLALAQMAGKGTVQMEELRGQLGEALPGALQAAANGLNMTVEDLIKLAEAGQLTASDVFPALAKGLGDIYGSAPQARTLSQEIVNLRNAFVQMAADIGEDGGLDALKTAAQVAEVALVGLDITLVGLGKTIGILMGAVATMDFSHVREEFAAVEAQGREKLLKAAQHNALLRDAIVNVGDAAEVAALKAQGHGTATEKAAQQAANASPSWAKLASDYGKVLAAIGEQADQAEKAAAARDAEGKAIVSLSQALGTEAEQRRAKVQATKADAEATAALAQARLTEVEVRKAELAALRALATQSGPLDEQKKKQLEDLQKDIALRQEVADKALAQARAAKVAASAAEVEAQAQQDHSGRVKELGDAYEQARAKLAGLRREQAAGKVTMDKVEAADLAAAEAGALYRDALADVTTNLKARQIAEQAAAQLLQATLGAERARYQSMIDAARADGDYATALYATIEQKKIDIEITRAKVAAMRAEADGAIAVAKAQLAEMDATKEINPVKRAQIEASIKVAEAKRLEAAAMGRATEELDRQIQALRDGRQQLDGFGQSAERAAKSQDRFGDAAQRAGDKAAAAAGKAAAALESQNAAQERLNQATEKAAELERKRAGVDKDGFSTGKDGNRFVAGGDLTTRTGIFNFLKNAGVKDEEAAKRIANEFADAQGNVLYMNNPGQKKYGGDTLSMALLKAAEQAVFAPTNAPAPAQATQGQAAVAPTYVSQITIDGRTRSVATADAASQQTLEQVLRELGDARRRMA